MMNKLISYCSIILFLAYSLSCSAGYYPVTTLNGTSANDARLYIQVWDSKHTIGHEEKRFTSSESINLSAIIHPATSDIGHNAQIYVVAFYNGTRYYKSSTGSWIPWTGPLHHADTRGLSEEVYIPIISGLSGLVGEFDIFVGYRNANSDIVYNSFSLHFEVTPGYNNIITVGENGQFSGCNGIQMALNVAQDWDEVRIQQGNYNCTGLDLPDSHNYLHGIKISGGWNSAFDAQTTNPRLTILDGGNPLVPGVSTHDECVAAGGWAWGSSPCYIEEPVSARIIEVHDENVLLENLSFQNAYHEEGGSVAKGVQNKLYSKFNRCYFYGNTSISGNGGALQNIGVVSNSIFESNHAYNGGAIDRVNIVNGNEFNHNSANYRGGALTTAANAIDNVFDSNTSHSGGAIYAFTFYNTAIVNNIFRNNKASVSGGALLADSYEHKVVNNLFVENSASSSGGAIYSYSDSTYFVNNTFANNSSINGGAFYGAGTIANSIFSMNMSDNTLNDITPDGDLTIDYSLFTALNGSATVGPHNLFSDPDFIDNANFTLQPESPAKDSGYNGNLYLNLGLGNYIDNYLLPYLRNSNGDEIDLNGNRRVVGDSIDMGAYEAQ